ncbi:MAG: hypothetical protein IGS03_05555 [Candidatus Sericytochromatia bacterium]|nr:hypothetical protein [Candidatus Sericytochromatia bacterium]
MTSVQRNPQPLQPQIPVPNPARTPGASTIPVNTGHEAVSETTHNEHPPAVQGDEHHGEDSHSEHHGFAPLARLNLSSGLSFQNDVSSAFRLGGDLGIQRHFGTGGHLELYATPGLGLTDQGEGSFNLDLNAHSEYAFDSGFLLSGGLHAGGGGTIFGGGHGDSHAVDAHGDTHAVDAHGDEHAVDAHAGEEHHGGVHFHGAAELQAGFRTQLGSRGPEMTLLAGGGLNTDFHHAPAPYATAGVAFNFNNRHEVGVRTQFAQANMPTTVNLTYSLNIDSLFGRRGHH